MIFFHWEGPVPKMTANNNNNNNNNILTDKMIRYDSNISRPLPEDWLCCADCRGCGPREIFKRDAPDSDLGFYYSARCPACWEVHAERAFFKRRRFGTREILSLAKATCEECHSDKELDLHHVSPLRSGGSNDLSNLKILCRPCHRRAHGGHLD
jgi:hypothetical protein